MSDRELLVLGTASQAPTRARTHNGYLLRWDGQGILFDPGEGTQRQMLFAGARASEINHICLTHFHGDHCLGLPGVLHRLSLDRIAHPVDVWFPAQNEQNFERLRHGPLFDEFTPLRPHPVAGAATLTTGPPFTLTARPLSHSVPAIGYRLAAPDGWRMLPEKLAAYGITGPDVGILLERGSLIARGRKVALAEVSVARRGQRFAFIMDTRLCDGAFELADGADMVVCEATFLDRHAALAAEHGHLTARQAGQLAAQAGARMLVLSHFSQRYTGAEFSRFAQEAGEVFGGELIVAEDLTRVPAPPRHEPPRR